MRTFTHTFLPVLCSAVLFFSSCKKHEEVVVPQNTAPPDTTVENVTYENYVNKVYISILGRKPNAGEYEQGLSILRKNKLSLVNRKEFLDTVFAKPEYMDNLYEKARADLLNSLDTAEITNFIEVFNFVLSDSTYVAAWEQITLEKQKLEKLQEVPKLLKSGSINTIEMHKRCLYNYFYDQINMGTENFVVSVYFHFLARYPSNAELAAAKDMVDGKSSILFFQQGYSKTDFIDIFFSSDSYYEGQISDLYNQFLFRSPTSTEMSSRMVSYKNSGSYIELQKEILSTDEYAGLK